MVTLKPIKLLPARERVASALRKAIISKQIGEGEVITLEATARQLGAIRNCLEMADEALEKKDSSSYSNYNQSFHYEIWTAAGNEKLKTMLSEMWNGLSMGLKSTEEEYARNSQEEHRQILAALESGDPKQAGEKMVFHIIRSMNDVLTRY